MGTLLHFTHDLFKNGLLLHMFSAVNESTWEHMKLLLAPTLCVMVFQYIYLGSSYVNIVSSLLVLLVVELLTIPLLYEPLLRVIKRVPVIVTIFIFYISILIGLFVEYLLLKNGIVVLSEGFSFVMIVAIWIIFLVFTYYPPKIFLCKDPNTGLYGDS